MKGTWWNLIEHLPCLVSLLRQFGTIFTKCQGYYIPFDHGTYRQKREWFYSEKIVSVDVFPQDRLVVYFFFVFFVGWGLPWSHGLSFVIFSNVKKHVLHGFLQFVPDQTPNHFCFVNRTKKLEWLYQMWLLAAVWILYDAVCKQFIKNNSQRYNKHPVAQVNSHGNWHIMLCWYFFFTIYK